MPMSKGFSIPADKKDGQWFFNRERFTAFTKRLKDGPYVFRIERFVRQRSLPQNAYLHAHPFPILAAHFGCSVTEVKRDLMGECWGWKTSPVTGQQVPIRDHTSEMNVEECNFFIDWLLPWALVEHGVELEPPNPEWMFEDKPKRTRAA